MIHSIDRLDSDRLDELVAGFVLGDLSVEEQRELDTFDRSQVASRIERTETAAARAFLTFESESSKGWVSPPESLQILLKEAVEQELSRSNKHPNINQSSSANIALREITGWFLAIAASVLAIASWVPLSNKRTLEASITERRSRLIAEADDVVQVLWQKPTDESTDGRFGDVVWSSRRQEGFMRINGLSKNDPTREQYQLWIFDPARDANPIDGGVFDVPSDGEVIVPIQAKLAVGDPTLFAITIEKPGGVVVSDKSRLPLLAKVVQ